MWNVAILISVITTAVMVKVGDIFYGSGNYNGLYDYCWYGSMCETYIERNKTKPFAHLSSEARSTMVPDKKTLLLEHNVLYKNVCLSIS